MQHACLTPADAFIRLLHVSNRVMFGMRPDSIETHGSEALAQTADLSTSSGGMLHRPRGECSSIITQKISNYPVVSQHHKLRTTSPVKQATCLYTARHLSSRYAYRFKSLLYKLLVLALRLYSWQVCYTFLVAEKLHSGRSIHTTCFSNFRVCFNINLHKMNFTCSRQQTMQTLLMWTRRAHQCPQLVNFI